MSRSFKQNTAKMSTIRAALHAATAVTLAYHKKQTAAAKRKKPTPRKSAAEDDERPGADQKGPGCYHFIGYVPAHGRVWELDGLRYAGPLEVGELPDPQATGGAWTDIVRPALHRRMQRLQRNDHIRYNLLAIVEDQYERASDRLELLKA